MGQTATVSTAIIDSTAIGRDVLTAADLAAAQAVLGIVPFDVTADYNFTGDITSSGDNKHYFIGQAGDADTAYLTTQYDGVNGQLASLATGSQSRRPLYVGGVANGTDSGILVGGSPAGYLRTGSNTSVAWSNTALVTYKDFRPQTDGDVECGRDGNRWESVYSVDGDFSGTLGANALLSGKLENTDGYSFIRVSGGTTSPIKLWRNTAPQGDNAFDMGSSTERFRTVYAVDGSFSGNLTSEVGGLQRVYSVGTEGDADTAFIEMGFSGTTGIFGTKRTGAAGIPQLHLQVDGSTKMQFTASSLYMYAGLTPSGNGTLDIGTSGSRWRNVYSVDGSFSGDITIDTNSRIKSDGYVRVGGDSGSALYIGTQTRIIHDTTGFYPNPDGFGSIGKDGRRFSGAYFVDGSFSGNLTSEVGGSYKLYNLGDSSATDSEYLETSFDTNVATLNTGATGAGVVRDLQIERGGSLRLKIGVQTDIYTDFRPAFTNNVSCGAATRRWYSVYGVRGSFTGNLTSEVGGSYKLYNLGTDGDADTEYLDMSWDTNECIIRPKSSGAGADRALIVKSSTGGSFLALYPNGNGALGHGVTDSIYFGGGYMRFGIRVEAGVDEGVELGTATRKWSDVNSVDGTFTGNLTSQVGGSYKLYTLGAEGDTDTEYLSVGAGTFGGFGIYATGTGAGATNRQIELLTNSRKSGVIAKADSVELYGNLTSYAKFAVTSSSTYSRQDFRPHSTGNYACGTTTYRWSNVASVDGDFSGDVIMAANVDFTGLPTADPVVAGRLWNDGGTMKISAG